jgi:hypothetical protein
MTAPAHGDIVMQLLEICSAHGAVFTAFPRQRACLAGTHKAVNHGPQLLKINLFHIKVFEPFAYQFSAIQRAIEIAHALECFTGYRFAAGGTRLQSCAFRFIVRQFHNILLYA